jgi:hypothetical protein
MSTSRHVTPPSTPHTSWHSFRLDSCGWPCVRRAALLMVAAFVSGSGTLPGSARPGALEITLRCRQCPSSTTATLRCIRTHCSLLTFSKQPQTQTSQFGSRTMATFTTTPSSTPAARRLAWVSVSLAFNRGPRIDIRSVLLPRPLVTGIFSPDLVRQISPPSTSFSSSSDAQRRRQLTR